MNRNIENELSNYLEITLNRKLSRSKISLMLEADEKEDINLLWKEHEKLRRIFNDKFPLLSENVFKKSSFSYFDLKIRIAENIFENCYFCEKRCNVNRNLIKGDCNVLKPKIASEFIHMGEEAPLVPSHTIFFTGCNFRCIYCQNFDISQFPDYGAEIKEEKLAKIIDFRRLEGARNVNFVGGDPTPNLLYILKTIRLCKENIAVIWNSNFLMSQESMELLHGFVDLYLSDFKYGPSDCAEKLSGVENYWETVTRNHLMAKKSGNIIIRHLVLPGHLECCSKPILDWIKEKMGKKTVINIMGQYRPLYKANESPKIMRYPSIEEINEIKNYARNLGLINLL